MKVHLNGIDPYTGQPLISATAVDWLGAALRNAQRLPVDPDGRAAGLPFGKRPESVEDAGWGLVCPAEEADELARAFGPLVRRRRGRVLCHEPGETAARWLARYGAGQGSILPERVPGYLLIAGGADRIPFRFSQELNVEYAVGRVHFGDLQEYARYAERTAALRRQPRRAAFFAPRHAMDPATQLSADRLVRPLALEDPVANICGCLADVRIAEQATRSALADLLKDPPGLLFTASHGLGWPAGDPQQPSRQGALLCQDWKPFAPVRPGHIFSGADVDSAADLRGMIAFVFACFGVGTPQEDSFEWPGGPVLAPEPFFSELPRRMLEAGAAAVIGHLDRAWGYSIESPGAGTQIQPFRNTIGRLLSGETVGYAVRDFQERYASLSVTFLELLRRDAAGLGVSPRALAAQWIERNDAGGYLVFGDPAARLTLMEETHR